jgi:SpoIIAA-like
VKIRRHGLSIGIERVERKFFLTLKAVGKLTHENYNAINPLIDAALDGVKDPKVTVFIDGSELEGWELRAAWDDVRLGLRHGNEFSKIATFGNKKWQERTAKIASWFVSGDVKDFDESAEALNWLQE